MRRSWKITRPCLMSEVDGLAKKTRTVGTHYVKEGKAERARQGGPDSTRIIICLRAANRTGMHDGSQPKTPTSAQVKSPVH